MLDRLAEAFASQREFIADASHELRTPITVIRGQLEVLAASDNPSAQEVRRAERVVQAEITRITRLVDDLLLLAQSERADFLRLEPIDLPPFVTELWDGVSLTADRRFELSDVPHASLRADPDRLAQALRNLAGNAVAHTSEHGGLIRLEVTRLASERIRFSVLDDGPDGDRHEDGRRRLPPGLQLPVFHGHEQPGDRRRGRGDIRQRRGSGGPDGRASRGEARHQIHQLE